MKVKDLIPWNRREGAVQRDGQNSVQALHADLDRVFDEFWRGFGFPVPRVFGRDAVFHAPLRIDLHETPNEVEVDAELPGMDDQDVDIRIADGTMTISGVKKAERTKEENGFVLRERSFGRLERVVPLPEGLNIDAANATFKNGVLTVTIPKAKGAQPEAKRVQVQRS
jgi:HSP20 family protein